MDQRHPVVLFFLQMQFLEIGTSVSSELGLARMGSRRVGPLIPWPPEASQKCREVIRWSASPWVVSGRSRIALRAKIYALPSNLYGQRVIAAIELDIAR